MSDPSIATWRIERRGDIAILILSGNWLVGGSGFRAVADLRRVCGEVGHCASLRFDSSGLMRWDSALLAFVQALQGSRGGGRGFDLDLSGLPEPVQRLMSLAAADHGLGGELNIPDHRSLAWRIGAATCAPSKSWSR